MQTCPRCSARLVPYVASDETAMQYGGKNTVLQCQGKEDEDGDLIVHNFWQSSRDLPFLIHEHPFSSLDSTESIQDWIFTEEEWKKHN